MNALETGLIILILTTMFFTGYMVRELEGEFIAEDYLTEKVQEQQWRINGLEQHVKQYEANACTDVIIETQIVRIE